jgi:Ras-related protein Rab-1A
MHKLSNATVNSVSSSPTRQVNASYGLAKRNYDHLVKTIIVGDSGVGKTCILRRFNDESFVDFHMTTIGVDFAVKHVEVGGKIAKLQIWDTAGQERFHTITTAYYKGADALLLVFDVTNPESFEHCERWLKEIKKQTEGAVPEIILVGNKVDMLPEERLVPAVAAKEFADRVQVPYIETSAKESTGVDEAFANVTKRCLVNRGRFVHPPIPFKPNIQITDAKRRSCPSCTIL